ncbi:hypothetical protein DFP72DRAFT_838600 [Ephemerocybe angulata]|uniref:Uncharacterized protein n=1 Tax=Ephemerocybe angulata TaxID=980116 RepID=A0A8H6MH90_9AGAR|nr:hypothetical protein DFP72DRAFT_838600 [Tulosesus angulatus]
MFSVLAPLPFSSPVPCACAGLHPPATMAYLCFVPARPVSGYQMLKIPSWDDTHRTWPKNGSIVSDLRFTPSENPPSASTLVTPVSILREYDHIQIILAVISVVFADLDNCKQSEVEFTKLRQSSLLTITMSSARPPSRDVPAHVAAELDRAQREEEELTHFSMKPCQEEEPGAPKNAINHWSKNLGPSRSPEPPRLARIQFRSSSSSLGISDAENPELGRYSPHLAEVRTHLRPGAYSGDSRVNPA